ncbi:MAG: dienelactone hydrolase family protein [Oligoflexales bacterium]|nr:dienelactone hydrolase family protein [Oligoflexales bacterium]
MENKYCEYSVDGKTFEAYLAYDPTEGKKKPAVLVAHAWAGRSQFEIDVANTLANWGYVGFAADVYGKGILGTSPEENGKLMAEFMEDRSLITKRFGAAIEALKEQEMVDAQQIAAVGFCFGGLCVLDLARSCHPDVKGVVSLHGLFVPPQHQSTGDIQSKVLALHGHEDPMVKPDAVLALEQELTERNADWQIHTFGKTFHGFTHPEANDLNLGVKFHELNSQRSFKLTKSFLEETLNK